MMTISAIATFIGELAVLMSVVVKLNKKVQRISNGTKCQLRSEMLRIYYHCKEDKRIRQYEYENFVSIYEAYKELGGNSFIDKIYDEVKEFEIIT